MGHYASEMGEFPKKNPNHVSAYEHEEKLRLFFKDVQGMPQWCPLCGATVKWDWTFANNLIRHVNWHEKNGF